jgi:hypothetical protein
MVSAGFTRLARGNRSRHRRKFYLRVMSLFLSTTADELRKSHAPWIRRKQSNAAPFSRIAGIGRSASLQWTSAEQSNFEGGGWPNWTARRAQASASAHSFQ